MTRCRTLIVDDSATMRNLIAAILRRDPEIDVVGHAADAAQARQAIKTLDPDVITLDIEMPQMNGLEFLERIMRLRPMPVVMVSSHTREGAAATMEALTIGAVDCVAKPSDGDFAGGFANLAEIVKTAARARVGGRPEAGGAARPAAFHANGMMVAIAASTGGVEAVQNLLAGFPENCPPTVIAQHMPASFTTGFAERLDRFFAPRVEEATDGAALSPGRIYIAPGGAHLEVIGRPGAWRCRLRPADFVDGPRPSADILFSSVAKAAGAEAVGVVLTGMGRDGAQGLLRMRQAGARTLAQDETSCVVYGMPRAASAAGAVEQEGSPAELAARIVEICNTVSARMGHAGGR
jgi:two-component system chemotaxis response regulator CheB